MNRHRYNRLVDDFTDWVLTRAFDLHQECGRPPLVVPLTVTYRIGAVPPDRVLPEFERLYARICRLLLNNPERPSKRPLLPFALAFRDDPSTRPGKHRAGDLLALSPGVAEHVHAVLVVHPDLIDRFLEIVGDLEAIWRGIRRRDAGYLALPRYDNGSLHVDLRAAARLRGMMGTDPVFFRVEVRDQIRGWIDYSAKLMRRRGAGEGGDLFTVLPTETNSAGRPDFTRQDGASERPIAV